MSPNILRRCSICKRFHAAYRVPEVGTLCYDCWKSLYGKPDEPKEGETKPGAGSNRKSGRQPREKG